MSDAAPPTLRTLLVLAWPVVIARATQAVIGFSDALLVAPLGEHQLAATTTASLDTYVFIILPMGTAFIIQSFAAQLTGQGRRAEARRYAWYGLALAAIAMVTALIAIPFLPWMVGALGAEPAVRADMIDYMELRLLSVGAAVGLEVFGSWYGGLGNTRMQLVGGVIAMTSNVALAWILIYGKFGAPEMGVAGAGLASSLATWTAFLTIAWCFHRGVGGAGRTPGPLGLRWSELRRVFRFGLPTGFNWFLEFIAFAVFVNVVIVDLGTSSLAALNVVIQINSVSFMPAFGVASAGAILAGQAIGAGRPEQVGGIVRLTMGTTAAWQGGIGLLYLIAPATLLGWFAPEGAQAVGLVAAGTVMLQISVAWQLFDACAMTLSEILRAAGDTTWPMLARLGLGWALFVPAGIITVIVLDGGTVGAMLCLCAYMAALALVLTLRFRRGSWKRIQLTEPDLIAEL